MTRQFRVGLVCPYDMSVPGGVQAHVRDLADTLLRLGHQVSVLAPADPDDTALPDYVVGAGRSLRLPFNGSVARIVLGPRVASRVRKWIREGEFDVLHLHEPLAPSVTLLACYAAIGPMVGTFHMATERSRAYSAASGYLEGPLDKIRARIAVSDRARTTLVEHVGGDAVLIPNGVTVSRFAEGPALPGMARPGHRIAFLGRIDEPRKGLPTLLAALPDILGALPDAELLVAGPGDADAAFADLPSTVRSKVTYLGLVSEADKAAMLRSADLYVAPNTGGESFGIVLLEAMAAGAPVLASDLDAFRLVLQDGQAGALFPVGDARALAAEAVRLLRDPAAAAGLSRVASDVVQRFDWERIAARIVSVYETVVAADERVVEDNRGQPFQVYRRVRATP
jgi:phosphatidyl-myo-inositol alpha-mannosyltransferase